MQSKIYISAQKLRGENRALFTHKKAESMLSRYNVKYYILLVFTNILNLSFFISSFIWILVNFMCLCKKNKKKKEKEKSYFTFCFSFSNFSTS